MQTVDIGKGKLHQIDWEIGLEHELTEEKAELIYLPRSGVAQLVNGGLRVSILLQELCEPRLPQSNVYFKR